MSTNQNSGTTQNVEGDEGAKMPLVAPVVEEKQEVKKKTTRKRKTKVTKPTGLVKRAGRRSKCLKAKDIAPRLMKTTVSRLLSSQRQFSSSKSLEQLQDAAVEQVSLIKSKDHLTAKLQNADLGYRLAKLKTIILLDLLLETEAYALSDADLVTELESFMVELAEKAEKMSDVEVSPKPGNTEYTRTQAYCLFLDIIWKTDDRISPVEEKNLKLLRKELGITRRQHLVYEAKLGHLKRDGEKAYFSGDEVAEAIRSLQKDGLVWDFRDDSDRKMFVIPKEIAREIRKLEPHRALQRQNMKRLYSCKAFQQKYLKAILDYAKMDSRYLDKDGMIDLIVDAEISPIESLTLYGSKGVNLEKICVEFGLPTSGAKKAVAERIVNFFDDLSFGAIQATETDERANYFESFIDLGNREYEKLKAKGLISKDLEIEHKYEEATDYAFEKLLNVTIEKGLPTKSADGKIYIENKALGRKDVVLWDNKSAEKSISVEHFLEKQFDKYRVNELKAGNMVLAFIVIAPGFTSDSLKAAKNYKVQTGVDVPMITSGAFQHLAESWNNKKKDEPFDVRHLSETRVFKEGDIDNILALI